MTVVFFSITWFFIVQVGTGLPIENDKVGGFHLEYFFTFMFGIDLVLFLLFRKGPDFWQEIWHDRKDLFYTFLGIIPALGCLLNDNYTYVIFQTIR